jgi:pimeloyl-ACP methyl ester carboxylesterase
LVFCACQVRQRVLDEAVDRSGRIDTQLYASPSAGLFIAGCCFSARGELVDKRVIICGTGASGTTRAGFAPGGGAGTATATPVTASTLVHRAPPGTVACPLTSGIFPISSGGLGPDVGWILRLLAAPGAEFVLPVIAPKVVLGIGNQVRSWLGTVGLGSPRAEQIWAAYCSLSDPPTRAAFLRTLRSVVDYRGQSVSALNRLRLRSEVPTLVICGERDQIIPVEHGYAVRAARPGSRLEVLAGLGHFPHVESPTEVASAIEEFIAASQDAADTTQLSSQSRGPHRNLEVSEDSKSELRRLFDDLKSRKQIEVAVGVLMGLRGYSSDEAVKDFVDAVHETGVSPGDLGRALIDLARGQEPPSHRAEALQRWGTR